MNTMSRRRSGLTMAEIVVAMAILLMGFLAVSGIFSRNLQLVERSAELTEASEIGRRVMEAIEAHPDSIPDPPAAFTPETSPLAGDPPFPPLPFPETTGDRGTYRISVTVEASGVAALKAVEVRVAWNHEQGVRLQKLFP